VIANTIERLEFSIYDQRLIIMPKHAKSPDNKIVIIDLDERSLQAEGQYPWNRIKVGSSRKSYATMTFLWLASTLPSQKQIGISGIYYRL
tara:strand:- start:426 stop:695 length:270 start_codon:yes stop_codon:yes gene_type:complete